MKKYFSMMVVFAAFLSLLFTAAAFADWGDKGKKAEHETKAGFYDAKDNVKDAANDAGDNLEDAADDVKDSIKDATN